MSEPPEVVVDTCNGLDHEHEADDGTDVLHQNGEDGYVNYTS